VNGKQYGEFVTIVTSLKQKKPNRTICDLYDVTLGSPAVLLQSQLRIVRSRKGSKDPWFSDPISR